MISLLIKQLSATEAPLTILFYLGAVSTIVSLPLALAVWRQSAPFELVLMAAAAGLASLGQVCMIRGFRIGEASALAPFDYARLPFALASASSSSARSWTCSPSPSPA